MDSQQATVKNNPFDAETWAQLPQFFSNLPRPVRLIMWGDVHASFGEREAGRLCHALADRFAQIKYEILPRRVNYPFYPVIGVMLETEDEAVDQGVRIVGNPAGLQMTSLIAAIQVVSFQGATLNPMTRVQLKKLTQDVRLEVLTAANDETGTLVAKLGFGLAVVNPHIRTFLIMADVFPEASQRYSVKVLPHTVVNGRYHIEGHIEEKEMLQHISAALKN